uniref:RRM domain-containing protein n=1 Tax=Kalanchoe fedtschenkoi TaxID=63787 RepID=A0A7N0UU16_KALFE
MSAENLQFKWGKKRGVGGKKKGAQFYGSFTYDGVEYKLYDCIYMWKDDEPEPFVGKIIKIWEDKTKKEAIAGKCNVICISKDDRNPQPTEDELQRADYVFYRIFDVKQLTVSETIPDTILGIDIKYIYNQREGQQPTVTTTFGTKNLVSNDICTGRTENGNRINSPKPSEDKSNTVQKVDAVINSHLQDKDDDDKVNSRPFKKPKLESCMSLPKEKDKYGPNVCSDGPSSPKSIGHKKADVILNISNGIVSKAPKVGTHVFADEMKGKSKLARELNGMDVVLPKERQLNEEIRTLANGKMPKDSDQTLSKQKKPSSQVMDLTRRREADKNRWFKQLPWEEKMENALRQGALVLLENLDPSYTSSDVEDIIWLALKETSTAKIVYRATDCSPLSGQAFAVFKTKEIAEKVVTKLEQECLMLSDGRPLIASFGNPCFPGKETLVGHFGIDKLKVQNTREKKEAVSTSHCSQPNSIEYEFAIEWSLLQERSKWQLRNLHKQQAADVKKIMAELKTKST